MKKNLIIIIVLITIIIAGVVAIIFINKDEPDNPIVKPPIVDVGTVDPADEVIIQDVNVRMRTDNRYIDSVYPTIKSFSDKEFENYINTQISQNIQEYRNEIEYIIDEDTPDTAFYRYITTYDKHTSGKYLSLVVNQDYQTGGIRSNTWKDIYNINVVTERLIYLTDLFKEGAEYEKAIISEITKQAKEKNYELMGGNGISKISSKQKFYIEDDKLVIYFDPSEIAATVYGELHFEMPFKMSEDGYFELK